jgi:hypothetical protein
MGIQWKLLFFTFRLEAGTAVAWKIDQPVKSNAAGDREDQTIVDAVPAEKVGRRKKKAPEASRAVPQLSVETAPEETRIHHMPSELLRAARGQGGPLPHALSSEPLIPLFYVDDELEDAHASEVSHSGVRIQPNMASRTEVPAARAPRPSMVAIGAAVLAMIAAAVGALIAMR